VNREQVTVKIFGEHYPLRTSEPAARLEEIARYVDARMREVAATGKVVATGKIAVLAARHIADELFRLREAAEKNRTGTVAPDLERRIESLAEALGRALPPPDGG
jgi:cell division protein ZapA